MPLLPSAPLYGPNELTKQAEAASCASALTPHRSRPAAWHPTPRRVRLVVRTLRTRLEALAARLLQHSSPSRRPPSTDGLATKRQGRMKTAERRKPGSTPGPPGPPHMLCESTSTVSLFPAACAGGPTELSERTPDHPPQVIALPGMRPAGDTRVIASGKVSGLWPPLQSHLAWGPSQRLRSPTDGVWGERADLVGARRKAVHALWASGLGIPRSQGAMQTRVDRVSAALGPHDTASGVGARAAPGNDSDATSWLRHGERPWRWGMAPPEVA